MQKVIAVVVLCAAVCSGSTDVRVLQGNSNVGLCSSNSITRSNSPSMCAEGAQVLGFVDWTPCCALDIRSDDDESNKCRSFEVGNAYCRSGDDCSTLGADDVFQMDLEFVELDVSEDCCTNCVCFGDPECVSFGNVEDLWIPCDAREDPFVPFSPPADSFDKSFKDCRIYKDICMSMTDPNNNACIWLRDDPAKTTNVGWDMAIRGSPCVPDIGKGEIKMNMYTVGTNNNRKFEVDLVLGERGIISTVEVRTAGEDYKLNAEKCFEEIKNGALQWDETSLPSTFYQVKNTTTEIEWQITDTNHAVSMHLLCVRATSQAIARINVQSITVLKENANQGGGFCVNDKINEAGDTAATLARHHECVANTADALNACKALVSAGLVDNQIPECANEWCSNAFFSSNPQINANKRQTCRDALKGSKSENNDNWIQQYCRAATALNSDLTMKACKKSVEAEGWFYAARTYGNGFQDKDSIETECQNNLSDYELSKKDECVDGIYIEVNKQTSGGEPDWVPKYFIPVNKPPCNENVIRATAEDDKDLFIYPVRVRQCDPVVEDGCNAPLVATCSKTPGANFEVTYINEQASNAAILENLVLDGKIICVPDDVNDQTNADYDPYHCLPNKNSIKKQAPEMCVCPA